MNDDPQKPLKRNSCGVYTTYYNFSLKMVDMQETK